MLSGNPYYNGINGTTPIMACFDVTEIGYGLYGYY